MKALRKHVAIALDGGGIRGTMIARALAVLEERKAFGDRKCKDVFNLSAGTSTGSIISAGLAAGLSGAQMHELYMKLGPAVFRKSLRTVFWFICRYQYSSDKLRSFLYKNLGKVEIGSVQPMQLVITAFDLVENRTRFIKTGKQEYASWDLVKAVMASCAVPTLFLPVDGQFVDGGVGSYANPCYLAAYEACIVRGWDPAETTVISLGTGRDPKKRKKGDANHYRPLDWLNPILGAFLQSADEEQVRVVRTFFEKLDFRRFQVDFDKAIPMDDASKPTLDELTQYGNVLADKIMKDETDDQVTAKAHKLP
jgi:predicted acylesterase/phospholipase RssA